ncbi:MAG: hypothetical protein ACXVGA_07955, partial [Mycobacteriaceae bacterium]
VLLLYGDIVDHGLSLTETAVILLVTVRFLRAKLFAWLRDDDFEVFDTTAKPSTRTMICVDS